MQAPKRIQVQGLTTLFSALSLIFLLACGRAAAIRPLGNHADATNSDTSALSEEIASPSKQTGSPDNEDQLLDQLFRDSPSGQAPRRKVLTQGNTAVATPIAPGAPSTLPTKSRENLPNVAPLTPTPIPAPDRSAPQQSPSTVVPNPTPQQAMKDEPLPTTTGEIDKRHVLPTPPVEDEDSEPSPSKKTAPPVSPGLRPETKPEPKPEPKPAPKSQTTKASAPTKTPVVSPGERVVIRALWDDRVPDGRLWTRFALQALSTYGRVLLKSVPEDIQNFCPNYTALGIRGRADFWVKFISAIAAAESHFNPKDFYTEKSVDSNGNNEISRGLLQLSLESSQAYHCDINNDADLEDPQKNIDCSIRILSKWISEDGVIASRESTKWLGGSRYWSTLRPYNNKYATIRQLTSTSTLCRQP